MRAVIPLDMMNASDLNVSTHVAWQEYQDYQKFILTEQEKMIKEAESKNLELPEKALPKAIY